jgi:hypothetical protein
MHGTECAAALPLLSARSHTPVAALANRFPQTGSLFSSFFCRSGLLKSLKTGLGFSKGGSVLFCRPLAVGAALPVTTTTDYGWARGVWVGGAGGGTAASRPGAVTPRPRPARTSAETQGGGKGRRKNKYESDVHLLCSPQVTCFFCILCFSLISFVAFLGVS